jgi:hypothetical protein
MSACYKGRVLARSQALRFEQSAIAHAGATAERLDLNCMNI